VTLRQRVSQHPEKTVAIKAVALIVGIVVVAAAAILVSLLPSSDSPLRLPELVLAGGLPPVEVENVGQPVISTTKSSMTFSGSQPSTGVLATWNPEGPSVLELTVDGVLKIGSLTLRVDFGDQNTAVWFPLDFGSNHLDNSFLFQVDGEHPLRVWLYSDEAVDATVTMVRLAPFSDNVRRRILDWAGCTDDDSASAVASKIRQRIHDCSSLQDAPPIEATALGRHQFLSSFMKTKKVLGYCGNLAMAEVLLLQEIGIAARPVSLASRDFAEDNDQFAAHVLLEFFDPDDGEWVLSDPTFNIGIENEQGNRIGLKAILSSESTLPTPSWSILQFPQTQPGRTAGEHNIPYKDLFWWVFAPSIDHFSAPVGDAYRATCSEIPMEFRSEIAIPSSSAIQDKSKQYR
jgi:hypothetical protein